MPFNSKSIKKRSSSVFRFPMYHFLLNFKLGKLQQEIFGTDQSGSADQEVLLTET